MLRRPTRPKWPDVLDDTLENYGFAARAAAGRLAELMAVQNTYLSTFQALGGLGLVLGTLGLAAVQLRSVLERRGELALMQAVGFRRRRLAAMVLWEHALLLIAGLALGTLSALVAVWPHLAGGAGAVPWPATVAMLAWCWRSVWRPDSSRSGRSWWPSFCRPCGPSECGRRICRRRAHRTCVDARRSAGLAKLGAIDRQSAQTRAAFEMGSIVEIVLGRLFRNAQRADQPRDPGDRFRGSSRNTPRRRSKSETLLPAAARARRLSKSPR